MTEPNETPRQFTRRINHEIDAGRWVTALIEEYTYAVYRLRTRRGFIEAQTIEGWLSTYREDIRVARDGHDPGEDC